MTPKIMTAVAGARLLALSFLFVAPAAALADARYVAAPGAVATPSFRSALAAGSTAIAGAGEQAWFLNAATGRIVRLDEQMEVEESVPLPPALAGRLSQRGNVELHLAPFAEGVWLLDPGAGEIHRFGDGRWQGPFRPGVAFSGGAAHSADELLLNTPEAPRPFALYRSEDGRLRAFGTATEAPHPRLRREYGSWVVGAAPGGWVAAHRFLPLLASFDAQGHERWSKAVRSPTVDRLARSHAEAVTKALPEASECCISVELVHLAESVIVRPGGSILINYSASPLLVEVAPDGGSVREIELAGDGVRSIDRFGFAILGEKVLAAVGGELRAFSLERVARLQGRVVDEAAEAVAGAEVALVTAQGRHSATTDPEGWFWLPRLADAGTVSVRAEGYLPFDRDGSASAILERDIVLEREPEVCLRVLDRETREAVERYEVEVARRLESADAVSTTEGPTHEVESADGTTCFRAPFPPPLLVAVSAPGYARWEERLGALGDVDVELEPEARLELEIHSVDGTPVALADAVLVEPAALERSSWQESFGGRSDRQGSLSFAGVPAGSWALIVRHPDYREKRQELELRPETNRVRVVLSAGSRAVVRVVRAEGAPVSGANVHLVPTGSVAATMQECTTGEDGTCEIAKLDPGRYRLAVEWHPGSLASRAVSIIGEREVFEVEVEGGDDVWGRLTAIEGYGDSTFRVAVRTEAGGRLDAAVDAAGRFLLEGLDSGTWVEVEVSALGGGFEGPWQVLRRVLRVPNASETLEIELPEPLAISGQVTATGRRCAWCRVTFQPMEGSGAVRVATQADGTYRALLAAPGRYDALVEGRGVSAHRDLEIAGSGRYDIAVDDASISGRVVLAGDGEGVESASVVLRRSDGTAVGNTLSAADGGFRFAGLGEDDYRLTVHHLQGVAEGTVSLPAEADRQVTLEIEPAGVVRIRLVDAETGALVVRGAIKLYDLAGRLQFERRFFDAGGEIAIPVAGEGPFVGVVSVHGFGLATLFDLVPDRGPAAVALRRPSTLIVDPSGATEVVALLDPQGRPLALSFGQPPGAIRVGPGPALFSEAPVGTHRLVAGAGQQVVELAPGGRTLVEP